MNPVDHPHGGGEGRTSGGRHPVTPVGYADQGQEDPLEQADRYVHRVEPSRPQEEELRSVMARSIWKGPFVDGYLLKKAEVARSASRGRGHQDLEPSLHDPSAVRRSDVRRLQRPQACAGERVRGNGGPQVRRVLADAHLPRPRRRQEGEEEVSHGQAIRPPCAAGERSRCGCPQPSRQPAEAEPRRPAHPRQEGRDRARRSRVLAQADLARRAQVPAERHRQRREQS